MTYRVLVVEDEDIAAEAHAMYVGRLPDFEMAGVARTAQAAVQFLQHDAAVDVILLDMHLPTDTVWACCGTSARPGIPAT